MTIEGFILAINLMTFLLMGAVTWNIYRTHRNIAQTTNLIREYRREIGWLTARLDALETAVKRSGK